MRSNLAPLLGAALLLAPLATAADSNHAAQVNHYIVERASTPIEIDGLLDEFAWQTTEQIDHFERILNDYDQVLYPTRAKMLWDDENFYFAFVCRDADMWTIYDEEDDHLWEEEVVEIFIDPDGDGRNYLELEVNPHNTVVDLRINQVEPPFASSIDWDIAGLQTAVKIYGTVNDSLAQDRGWSAEIAIPWQAMADSIDGGSRPEPGASWRLNLYRIERKAGRDAKQRINALTSRLSPLRTQIQQLWAASGVETEEELDEAQRDQLRPLKNQLTALKEEIGPELEALQDHYRQQTEFTAWSETYQRGFHHPARFGVVHFAE